MLTTLITGGNSLSSPGGNLRFTVGRFRVWGLWGLECIVFDRLGADLPEPLAPPNPPIKGGYQSHVRARALCPDQASPVLQGTSRSKHPHQTNPSEGSMKGGHSPPEHPVRRAHQGEKSMGHKSNRSEG